MRECLRLCWRHLRCAMFHTRYEVKVCGFKGERTERCLHPGCGCVFFIV